MKNLHHPKPARQRFVAGPARQRFVAGHPLEQLHTFML